MFALTLMLVVAAATSVASFAVIVSEDSVTSENNQTGEAESASSQSSSSSMTAPASDSSNAKDIGVEDISAKSATQAQEDTAGLQSQTEQLPLPTKPEHQETTVNIPEPIEDDSANPTQDQDAYTEWLIGLDENYLLANIAETSRGIRDAEYMQILKNDFSNDTHKAASVAKMKILQELARAQGRESTSKENRKILAIGNAKL
jgi:hypothetical protein